MFPWLLALVFAMVAVWAYLQALYWRELYEEERRINKENFSR